LLDLQAAGILVLVQLIVISLFTLVYTQVQKRLSVRLMKQKVPKRPAGLARSVLVINLVLAFLLILSPLLALAKGAFWSEGRFGFENVRYLFTLTRTIGFAGAAQAIINSLRFAILSSVLALFVGLAFAYASQRGNWRWLDNLSLLPLATSAVTLGFGYLIAFPQLRSSIWGLTLAHTLLAFPFVARSILPALRSLPENLVAAAATLGASPVKILARVELPLLIPSLITALSFAFAISMGEFGASLTVLPSSYATIPIAIFDRLGRPGLQNYGAALALAFFLMVITAVVMLLLERFGEGEF
jgi:thiamine transport system permease protein